MSQFPIELHTKEIFSKKENKLQMHLNFSLIFAQNVHQVFRIVYQKYLWGGLEFLKIKSLFYNKGVLLITGITLYNKSEAWYKTEVKLNH